MNHMSVIMKGLRFRKCFILVITGASLLLVQKSAAQTKKIDSLTKAIASYIPDDNNKAKMIFELSALYIYSNPKKSLTLMDGLFSFESKIQNENIVSSAYRVRGIILYMLSDFQAALTSLRRAYQMDKQNNNKVGQAGDLGSIASVYMAFSNYPEALNYYLQSAKIYETLKGQENDATSIYANIGLIYSEQKNYDEALAHLEKSRLIFKRRHNLQGEANSTGNIANVYSRKKNFQKAVLYCKQAIAITTAIDDKIGTAREMGNLSSYYSSLGQYDLALANGLSALALNKALGNKKSISYNQNNMAEAYRKTGDLVLARNYALASLKGGKELNILEVQRDASEGLSQVYEQKGMQDSSLYYFKQYALFKDSIGNDEKTKEITRMNISYDYEKKESAYKQQQLLSDGKLKQQQLLLALNNAEIQKGVQLRDLQQVQLQNEKLQTQEKEKRLVLSLNKEKLQAGKVKALSQEQQLNKLRMSQFWLYGVLFVVVLISVSLYLLNVYRIRQLRYKNTLQQQQAAQQTREMTYQYQLSESELKAIRAQMNPHFIFNVLNSIESYIMENDKVTASRLIQKFASLSRLILENSVKSLVSAEKEWKALIIYTELQALRYSGEFRYEFKLATELPLSSLLLPPMLIQPLIENAIYHGLIPADQENKELIITLAQFKDHIQITVADNGIGLNKSTAATRMHGLKEKSMGLDSIRERIEMINLQHQTSVASFSVTGVEGGDGTVAIVTLPILLTPEPHAHFS